MANKKSKLSAQQQCILKKINREGAKMPANEFLALLHLYNNPDPEISLTQIETGIIIES